MNEWNEWIGVYTKTNLKNNKHLNYNSLHRCERRLLQKRIDKNRRIVEDSDRYRDRDRDRLSDSE